MFFSPPLVSYYTCVCFYINTGVKGKSNANERGGVDK
jgi:hypothetical protein